MIKKITNPSEFQEIIDKGFEAFGHLESEGVGHKFGLKHDKESIKRNFANASILAFRFHVWVDIKEGELVSILILTGTHNPKFAKEILNEFFWASKDANSSVKILKEAESWGVKNGYEFITMSVVDNMPRKNSLKVLYKRLGYEKDSETFMKPLV